MVFLDCSTDTQKSLSLFPSLSEPPLSFPHSLTHALTLYSLLTLSLSLSLPSLLSLYSLLTLSLSLPSLVFL